MCGLSKGARVTRAIPRLKRVKSAFLMETPAQGVMKKEKCQPLGTLISAPLIKEAEG
jgi:hypothetical protein